MRILLPPLLFIQPFHAQARVGFEDFYSEKDLQSVLRHPATLQSSINKIISLRFQAIEGSAFIIQLPMPS